MGKKKHVKKTVPIRLLEQKGIPYQVHQHAHKQHLLPFQIASHPSRHLTHRLQDPLMRQHQLKLPV